jgi:hypothetical protein
MNGQPGMRTTLKWFSGGSYKQQIQLVFWVMTSCMPVFQRNLLSPSSGCGLCNAENHTLNLQCCKTFRSCIDTRGSLMMYQFIQAIHEKLTVAQIVKKLLAFYGAKDSLLCSQEPAYGPILNHTILLWDPFWCYPSICGLFPSGFPSDFIFLLEKGASFQTALQGICFVSSCLWFTI